MNREEAIIILTNVASLLRDGTRYMKPEHEKQFREAFEMAIKALEQEQPERKKGKWGNHGECPFCSYLRQWEDDRFCGNCGADMRGEQE